LLKFVLEIRYTFNYKVLTQGRTDHFCTKNSSTSQPAIIHYGEVTSHICGRNTISILWGNTVVCVYLSDEDLSRYSNKLNQLV